MLYLIQSSLTLALLYPIYWLFLRRTGFHALNRYVLLGIAVISLLLPTAARLLPNLTPTGNLTASGFVKYTNPPSLLTAVATSQKNSSPISIIEALYFLGLLFFAIRTLAPILTLINLIRRSNTTRYPGYTLVHLQQPSPPFSFFRWIFLHPGDYSEAQYQQILEHEQIHVKHQHTLDILLMEAFTALFWFHPLAWRLNTMTKLNLEYLADRQLINTGIAPKEYQYHLLQLTIGPTRFRSANYFNHSHLKKRIAMMNNNTTRRISLWKYLFFMPALAALCLAFGSLKAQTTGNSDIYLVIRPGLTERQLHQIETYLANDGVSISFSKLSYTANHELAGLRMIVGKGSQIFEDITIDGTDQPLGDPLIFYWFRSRQGPVVISRGYPSNLEKTDLNILRNLSGLLLRTPNTNEIELHGSARLGD